MVLGPSISTACSCVDSGKDSEDKVIDAACEVDVVFVGKATDQVATQNQTRVEIEPVVVYKGNVRGSVVAETVTTCDHWFSLGESYLIFGSLDITTNRLTTSICGPTDKLNDAQDLLRIVRDQAANFDELCGPAETRARRLRILSRDRDETASDS